MKKAKLLILSGIFFFFASALICVPLASSEIDVIRQGFMNKSFGSGLNIKDARVALKLWLDKLYAEQLGRFETEVTAYVSLHDVIKALNKNKLDLLACNSLDFVRINREHSLEVCFLGITGGHIFENYVLLVDKNKFKNLESLKGQELLLECGTRYEQAQMWLDLVLQKKGLPRAQDFFSKIIRPKKVAHAVLPVFFGKKQVCLTVKDSYQTMTELNPQISRKLIIIEESPGYLRNVISWDPDYDNVGTKTKVAESAFKLHEDEVGKQIFLLFKLEQGVPYKPEYIKSVEELEDKYLSVFGSRPDYWK